jgi:hypothetical protein
MSRGRLSDCSGSTTGKMDVRVLTHSQAVGSACERRESIACARWALYAFCFVQARVRGKKKNRASARARGVLGLVIDAVRTETVHGLRNDQGMPVFTPGSNPRRLPAAACRRGSWFLSSSRGDGSRRRRRAARRGAAGRRGDEPLFLLRVLFSRSRRSIRVRDVGVRSASARERRREGGDGQTRARNRLDDGAKREKTKKTNARGVHRGQDRNES